MQIAELKPRHQRWHLGQVVSSIPHVDEEETSCGWIGGTTLAWEEGRRELGFHLWKEVVVDVWRPEMCGDGDIRK